MLKERKNHITILLCLVILLAAFLRIFYLSAPSYSGDDIKLMRKCDKISVSYVWKNTVKKGRPMLNFVCRHYWKLLAGSSEFAQRLPTAIFGILSVFVLFKLASLIFDDRTALIGALFLAVNPEHFFLSSSLKPYTLVVLLGLTSLYLLIRAFKEGRAILWIAFCISNVALLYTHKSAVFIALTEICFMAIAFRKHRYSLHVFSSIGIICIFLVVFFFLQRRHLQIFSEYEWIMKPTLVTFFSVYSSFVAGFLVIISKPGTVFADGILFNHQGPYIEALSLTVRISILTFFSLLLIFGVYRYFWNGREKPTATVTDNYKPLVYLWASVPIVAAYAISYLIWPSFGPTRYHVFWSCALLLLIAKGIASFGKLRFICPILFIAVGIHLFPIITAESNPRNLNWKGVASYLQENVSEGEEVYLLSNKFAVKPLRYYFRKNVRARTRKNTILEKLTRLVREGSTDGVYLVRVGKRHLPKKLSRLLGKGYAEKEVTRFKNISVTHYWKPRKPRSRFRF